MKGYAKKQFTKLMIPYFIYMLIDFAFFDNLHDLNRIFHYLWGGRFINGVYWYITCFLISSILFVFLLKHLPSNKVIGISIIGGMAILEANIVPFVLLLGKPGFPFGVDVVPLCISYITIGYYGKQLMNEWKKSEQTKTKWTTLGIGVVLVIELIYAYLNNIGRTLDMKQVIYFNPFYVYIIPIGYGLVLLKMCHYIANMHRSIDKIFQILGQMTVPIMYLYEPLNRFLEISHNNILCYVAVGIGVPILLVVIAQRHFWGRYLGIYPIQHD